MMNRPKGSSHKLPGSPGDPEVVNDWVCYLCECAPLGAPPGDDNPRQMAELEWSDDFKPPSKSNLKKFWGAEHAKAAADYAAKLKADEQLEAERRLTEEADKMASVQTTTMKAGAGSTTVQVRGYTGEGSWGRGCRG